MDRDYIRLDMWLWCTRFAKHRSLCTQAVKDNSIRVNGQIVIKPHAKIRINDILTLPVFAAHPRVRVIKVIALPTHRLSASLLSQFYEEIS